MPSPGARLFTDLPFDELTSFQNETTDAAGGISTTYEVGSALTGFRGNLTTGDTDWLRLPRGNFTEGNQDSVTVRVMTAVEVVGINGTDTSDLQLTIYRGGGLENPENPDLATGIATRVLFAPDNNGFFYVEVSSISGSVAEYELRPWSFAFSYTGDDNLQNWIQANSPDALVYGLAGNDTLNPQGSRALVYAGDGDDSVIAADDFSIFFGGNGNDTLIGGGSSIGETHELYGGNGDDRIDGGTFSDGGAGNDTIQSNDLLIGGTGDDLLRATSGFDDRLYGGSGQDTLDSFSGDDTIFGGSGDDLFSGGRDQDRLRGGNGDDTLFGGSGNDILQGGAGADSIRGGTGFDTADYRVATQGLVLDLSDQSNNAGAAAGDVLASIEAIRGTDFADQITGNAFRNVLHGRGGDDTLTGGGGEDVFVFTVGGGADVITDFDASEDILRIASGSSVSVVDDGTDTTVTYGSDSVVLLNVVLSESEIDIAFF